MSTSFRINFMTLGEKWGMTDNDWVVAEKLGLKKATVLQRLQRWKGDKSKVLVPLHQQKRNQIENLGKARSTRLPIDVDRALIEESDRLGITISDLIAKAVIAYLNLE